MARELTKLLTVPHPTRKPKKPPTREETCAACQGVAWSLDTGEECSVCEGRGRVTVRAT